VKAAEGQQWHSDFHYRLCHLRHFRSSRQAVVPVRLKVTMPWSPPAIDKICMRSILKIIPQGQLRSMKWLNLELHHKFWIYW